MITVKRRVIFAAEPSSVFEVLSNFELWRGNNLVQLRPDTTPIDVGTIVTVTICVPGPRIEATAEVVSLTDTCVQVRGLTGPIDVDITMDGAAVGDETEVAIHADVRCKRLVEPLVRPVLHRWLDLQISHLSGLMRAPERKR